jgi:hypothetical protein
MDYTALYPRRWYSSIFVLFNCIDRLPRYYITVKLEGYWPYRVGKLSSHLICVGLFVHLRSVTEQETQPSLIQSCDSLGDVVLASLQCSNVREGMASIKMLKFLFRLYHLHRR